MQTKIAVTWNVKSEEGKENSDLRKKSLDSKGTDPRIIAIRIAQCFH